VSENPNIFGIFRSLSHAEPQSTRSFLLKTKLREIAGGSKIILFLFGEYEIII
jgi:hypothetical protein